jgi:hypothetical protein
MEYWTLLIITIFSEGPLENATSGLVYRSMADCEAAIPAVVVTLDNQYDFKVACQQTEVPSSSIRPKRNPFYEEN